ncbi:MAG: hypothetical protein MZV63_59820 [Marinilabiliales bacterium]|nr:hypothetical protein [Marinilabiliales bacterium]
MFICMQDYTSPDSVAKIEKYVLEYPFVKEVYYQESLLFLINENVKKISLFLLVISSFLFLIALTIINNTIRLSIYSKRFLIQDNAACWCNTGIHQEAIHPAECISRTSCCPDGNDACLWDCFILIEKEFFMMFTFESTNLLIIAWSCNYNNRSFD